MIPSIILNSCIVVFALGAAAVHTRKSSIKIVLRFFTALSNLFCAAAALAVVICRLCGTLPPSVSILKFIGTAAVTVTLITVFVFLGPNLGYWFLLKGPDFFLHLACPVLAIISCCLWDKTGLDLYAVILGALPVILYGILYLYKVVLKKSWDDFYGFNRHGKWPLSYIIMVAGAFLISWILWVV